MLAHFPESELLSASVLGTYIFHEDYFIPFVLGRSSDEMMMQRVATYIEFLASSEDQSLHNLAEIGILEALVSRQDSSVAVFLGPQSKALLVRVLPHFDVDPKPWLSPRKL